MENSDVIEKCWPLVIRLLVMLLAVLCIGRYAYGSAVEFDTGMLEQRGFDAKVADWFREAARFTPGQATVELTVNGHAHGRVRALFGQEGELCPDVNFMRQAGLIVPKDFPTLQQQELQQICYDLASAWPQASVTPEPSEGALALVVPQEALSAAEPRDNWHHGGVAGLMNYSGQYMASGGKVGGMEFWKLGSEIGFNADNWIVRSNQTWSGFKDGAQLQHQNAYAQRTFTRYKSVFQAGQISLSNGLFGVGQVLGMQVLPEKALYQRDDPVMVEGIAQSQSVVEVRQSGILLYNTTVPAGPFRLRGFSLLNSRSDLEVTLTGSDGTQRQFSVPAVTFPVVSITPGVSFGAGKLAQQGSSDSPLLVSAANGWQLTSVAGLNTGLLYAKPYQAGAAAMTVRFPWESRFFIKSTLAQNKRHAQRGIAVSTTLSHSLTENLSLSLNTEQQSRGYRELSDALRQKARDSEDLNRSQWGASAGWSAPAIGSLTLSWARSTRYSGDNQDFLRASWARQFNKIYAGLNLERNSGGSRGTEERAYLTLRIPIGDISLNTWVNSDPNTTRYGMRFNQRLDERSNWGLSAERDHRSGRGSVTGSAYTMTPINQLSASLTHDSNSYTSWSVLASGGMALHADGITLSPYKISDTFGIARVANQPGVRIDSSAGAIWTDSRGYAVLPALGGWRRTAVQVDTRSLTRNADILNAWQETEAASGSVSWVNFDVVSARRVLVATVDATEQPLPANVAVYGADDSFITITGKDGSLFVPDALPGMVLSVELTSQQFCSLILDLPKQPPQGNSLYETISATCQ